MRYSKKPEGKEAISFVPSPSSIPPPLQDERTLFEKFKAAGEPSVKGTVPNITREKDQDAPPKAAKDILCRKVRTEARQALEGYLKAYDSGHSMSTYNLNVYSHNQVRELRNLLLFRLGESLDLAIIAKLSFPEFLFVLHEELARLLLRELKDNDSIIQTLLVSEELEECIKK